MIDDDRPWVKGSFDDDFELLTTPIERGRKVNICRKGIPCEYATINGFCQLTACLKHLRERKEE